MGKYFVLQVGHISYNFDWATNFINVDFVCDHFFLTKPQYQKKGPH